MRKKTVWYFAILTVLIFVNVTATQENTVVSASSISSNSKKKRKWQKYRVKFEFW